uniref:hypothetical protein n=1 Tax=Pseudomonas syringae TaxID=317 RepID=UPI0019671A41
LTTQSVETAFLRWSVRNDNLNYRARCAALLPEGRVSLLTKTPVQSLITLRGHAGLRNRKTR